ncbi:RING finger protein 215-like [Porites lutea]|uniref:RING finger protein 215-like n=1 Tax=Porites lutea TaxID=51062 RepID=UPI003CC5F9FF
MFPLRVSLSGFVHCFLRVLCFTVLVLGEVDKAFVNVIVQSEDGQNSSFANIVGKFARVGAIKQVEGELIEMDSYDSEDSDPDEDDATPVADEARHGWIGVIHIPVLEYYNVRRGSSKSWSVLEKVKKAMFLGASAIIIITLNQRVLRKLDLAQMFPRPIVTVNGTRNVSKLMAALQSGKQKLRGIVSYNSSLVELKLLSTLTFWATCGRPSGWEGVVCLGNPEKGTEEVNSQFFGSSAFFASVLFCLLVLKTQLSQLFHNYWISKKEQMLRQEAAQAIAKLKIRKYRRVMKDAQPSCSSASSKRRARRDVEVCAVCLDEFYNNQLVRTLPCAHEFHCECVDRWLLAKRTCPLCKGNIIGSLASEKTGPINPWERFNMGESSLGNETVRRRQRPFEALTSASDNVVTHISGRKKQCSRTGS